MECQVSLDMELKRPVARYELVANDVAKFLKRFDDGTLSGSSFTVRLKYISYLNVATTYRNAFPATG